MQAHTQKEFEASVKQGVSNADRQGGGWLRLTCRQNPRRPDHGLSFYVDGTPSSEEEGGGNDDGDGHNFKQDPWSRHLVQFEGESVPALVFVCGDGATDHQAFLAVASGPGGVPARSSSLVTCVRSLGYVGSFLREYGSAAELLARGESNELLQTVAAPGSHGLGGGSGGLAGGTFVPRGDVRALDTSVVPLNSAQRDAVLNLTGGLDLIVGPPGRLRATTTRPALSHVSAILRLLPRPSLDSIVRCIRRSQPTYPRSLVVCVGRKWLSLEFRTAFEGPVVDEEVKFFLCPSTTRIALPFAD